MKELLVEKEYEKCIKKLKKKHCNMEPLKELVGLLLKGTLLPGKYKDHALTGNLQGYRECHIKDDNWLLMYKSTDTEIILVKTGTHDDFYK